MVSLWIATACCVDRLVKASADQPSLSIAAIEYLSVGVLGPILLRVSGIPGGWYSGRLGDSLSFFGALLLPGPVKSNACKQPASERFGTVPFCKVYFRLGLPDTRDHRALP